MIISGSEVFVSGCSKFILKLMMLFGSSPKTGHLRGYLLSALRLLGSHLIPMAANARNVDLVTLFALPNPNQTLSERLDGRGFPRLNSHVMCC